MAESSSVRLLQQHLRQAGALLAARQFDVASKHIDAALAIDPASLSALTLRDRLMTLRGQMRATTPSAAVPAEPDASPRFVPSGVNAASWIDFEKRIQERRFRGLVETAERAVAAGDGAAARAAIEEARELQPDSGEIARLSARVALLQIPAARPREGLFQSRTFRAASLLLLGVMSLMGLDWVRSGTPREIGTTRRDVVVKVPDSAVSAPATPSDRESAAVLETRGTSGEAPERLPLTYTSLASPAATPAPVVIPPRLSEPERPPLLVPGETPDDYVVQSSANQLRAAASTPTIVRGEVSDDYVAPRRDAGRETAPAAGRPLTPSVPLASVVRVPSAIDVLGTSTTNAPSPAPPALPAAVTASAAAAPVIAPASVSEDSRINALVNQYANAYGQLNAAAVRSIWPTVDERALAKAFANLSSQNVTFDGCDINVNGATARALCRGRASYVVKVGSQERHNEPRTVRFDLRRDGDTWKIQKAETTR